MYKRPAYHLLSFDIISGDFETFDFTNPHVCHGGKGGGGTNTVTQQSSPPPEIMAAYQQALGNAQTASSAPLQQYTGQTVAGFTPDQLSAFGTINGAQGAAQPFIQGAQNLIQQGTQPLWNGVQQFSPDAVNQYASPYTSQVLNAQTALEQNQDAQQQAALQGNTISSGAWGGDRAGVASAILSGQQALANNSTNANILNTGYNNAVGEFNTQQQAQLGANEANSYLNQQGAFGLANLGNEALGTQLQGASAQLQSGATQQQLAQENLNVPYQNFLQQQAYPFQTAQYYANIAEGLGGASGGTGTTTSPGPSTASQIGGLGLGGLGLYGLGSAAGLFGGSTAAAGSGAVGGAFGNLFTAALAAARGGRINKYASGGGVSADIPDLSVSFIPQSSNGRNGAGPPRAPSAAPSDQGSVLQNIPLMTNIGNLLHKINSPGTSATPSPASSFGGLGTVIQGTTNADSAPPLNLSGTGNSGNALDLSTLDLNKLGETTIGPFNRGGRAGYSGGGSVLTDILSGLGDVAGLFMGDPMLGDQLSGMTGNPGVGSQFMSGKLFTRGGAAHYDDGGAVGGMSPMSSQNASQQNPTASSNLNTMTPEQLQQLVMRLPIGSQQAQAAAAVLQQKRAMPNVGAHATGGFGAQAPTMARGGALGFDDGGDVPPPDQDALDRALAAQTEIDQDVGTPDVPQVQMSALAPPPSMTTAPEAMGSARPVMTASAQSPSAAPQSAPAERAAANPWLALANAGFAMAAGNSPYAAQNIGRGAMEGISNYQQQQKEADTVNQSADRLLQEAKQHKDAIALEQQKADEQKTYQQGELGIRQKQLDQGKFIPVADVLGGKSIYNTATGTFVSPPESGASSATPGGGPAVSIQNAYKAPEGPDGKPLVGDPYLATVPSQIAETAREFLAGARPPPSGTAARNPILNAGFSAAIHADKNFAQTAATRYNTLQDFRKDKTTTAFNVATGHLALLSQLADAMDNGDVKQINAVSNRAQTELGLSSAPTNMDALKQLVSGEIVKATTGAAGALGDRDTIQHNIGTANSPKLIKDAIHQVYLPAIKSQLEGIEKRYESGSGLSNYRENYLLPQTREILGLGAGNAGSASSGIPPADQRVKGQIYTNANGHSGMWTGTGWAMQ